VKLKKDPTMKKLLLLPLLLLIWAGCTKTDNQASAALKTEAALVVRVLKAEPRTFERRLTVQGNIEAKQVAHVASRLAGNIDSIMVDEGDHVEADKTVLFQIDPLSLKNSVTASEQQLAVTQASLEVAKASLKKSEAEAVKVGRDFERFQRLHNEGRVTAHEFELQQLQQEQAKIGIAVSEANVGLAESQVQQAKAALEISRKNLQDAQSIAPLTGIVTQRSKEPGEQVSIGEVILRIEDPSSLEAVAYLPAAYYQDVLPGKTEARLKIAGKEVGTFLITYRSPVIDTMLRTFEIKGKIDFQEAIAGAMAELTLVFEKRQGLGVPSNSLLTRNNSPALFCVKEDKAVLKTVAIGLSHDNWTEITSGLEIGETVVVEGQSQLRENLPVTILK
jgi:multidrug efflux pump subunit AcrA (membrane-fusion protein)